MNYCKYCGEPIPDGSVCSCPAAQAAAGGTDNNAALTNVKHSKRNLIIGGGVFLIALIIVIAFISSLFGGGYKSTIKDLEKAMNKCDGDLLAETMLPDDMIDDLSKKEKESITDMLELVIKIAESEYGDNIKFKIEIEDKEKLSKRELEKLAEDTGYADKDYKLEKGYELELKMTVSGKDKKDTDDGDITVVKIKGEGWKIAPDSLSELF